VHSGVLGPKELVGENPARIGCVKVLSEEETHTPTHTDTHTPTHSYSQTHTHTHIHNHPHRHEYYDKITSHLMIRSPRLMLYTYIYMIEMLYI